MTERRTILICDDDPRRAERWAETVRQMPDVNGFEVALLSGTDLAAAIDALNARRELARDERRHEAADEAERFDTAAIVLADYDLTPAPEVDVSVSAPDTDAAKLLSHLRGRSGERLVYLARCYSTAGYLVVINQRFQEATFDVTLQRFAASYADLNLTQADLENPALWSGQSDRPGEFHPWAWPALTVMDAVWQRRIDAIDLAAPVLETLGLGAERFSARQLDLLGELADTEDAELADVKFGDLVRSSFGLDIKDRQPSEQHRQAIAAWVTARWLNRVVLAGQNVVSDLPHLATRYPALVGSAPELWQAVASKKLDDASVPAVLRELDQKCEPFLDRPAWPVSAVRDAVADLDEPEQWPDLVFCEDTSRFVPLEEAVEVETDVPGPYSRRFIEKVRGVRYDPLRRVL